MSPFPSKFLFFSFFLIFFSRSFSQTKPTLLIFDSSKVCDGYLLWQDKTKCQLMDRKGNVLYNFPGNLCSFFYNKNEIVTHVAGNLTTYNKNLDVIWKVSTYIDHELVVTPQNNILLYAVDYDSINHMLVRFDKIRCFDSTGRELYQWSTLAEHRYLLNFVMNDKNIFRYNIKGSHDPDSVLYKIAPSLTGITRNFADREFFHMNSIQVIPANESEKKDSVFRRGNLLLSFCNYNDSLVSFIAIVDPNSYKILWYYVQNDGKQMHTPGMLPNGNILMYVNSDCRNAVDSSFIDEINPVTKTVVWNYVERLPDVAVRCSHGSCQRLPNGNTLIANINGYIYEVTPQKKIVWQWHTVDAKHLYRAFLYPKEKLQWIVDEQ